MRASNDGYRDAERLTAPGLSDGGA